MTADTGYLQSKIAELKDEVGKLHNKVETLRTELERAEIKINELNKFVSKIEEYKKYIEEAEAKITELVKAIKKSNDETISQFKKLVKDAIEVRDENLRKIQENLDKRITEIDDKRETFILKTIYQILVDEKLITEEQAKEAIKLIKHFGGMSKKRVEFELKKIQRNPETKEMILGE